MATMNEVISKTYVLELDEREYKFLCNLLQTPIGQENFGEATLRRDLWNAMNQPQCTTGN